MMKIGFIGCGNMGGALALAASRSDECSLLLCDKNAEKVAETARKTNGTVCAVDELIRESDYIFIGVKPQFLADLFDEIRPLLSSRKPSCVFVSMVAGMTLEKISMLAKEPLAVIRIMPNTPVAVGQGMILYTPNASVSEERVETFLRCMTAAGRFDRLPEELIDAGCAVSGCGPAFMFVFARAVAEGGRRAGLSEEQALLYAKQTMLGSAALALYDPKSLDELIRNVCSPGGSTIEGVKILEQGEFDDIVRRAVKASFDRTVELGKQ